MTQDEIIEMARQADFEIENGMFDLKLVCVDGVNITKDLEAFAELVRADEREACAKLVHDNALACDPGSMLQTYLASNAAAIRARGNT